MKVVFFLCLISILLAVWGIVLGAVFPDAWGFAGAMIIIGYSGGALSLIGACLLLATGRGRAK